MKRIDIKRGNATVTLNIQLDIAVVVARKNAGGIECLDEADGKVLIP